MAAPTDVFPSFSEMCQRARDIERRLLPIQPGQTEGEVHSQGGDEIFPKEYGDYTYAFMLDEAQRIERQLSLSGKPLSQAPVLQVPSLPVLSKPPPAEAKVEKELHSFATPRYIYTENKDDAQIAEEEQASLPSRPPNQGSTAPLPQTEEKSPSPPPKPSSIFGTAGQGAVSEKPRRVLPVKIPAIPIFPAARQGEASEADEKWEAPLPPPSDERGGDEGGKPPPPGAGEEGQAIGMPLEPPEPGPLEEKEEGAPLPPKGEGGAASPNSQPRFMTSSKISPRLRAIIEEKLRREEATGDSRKIEEDIEIPRAVEGKKPGKKSTAAPEDGSKPVAPLPSEGGAEGGQERLGEELPPFPEKEGEGDLGEPEIPVPEKDDWQTQMGGSGEQGQGEGALSQEGGGGSGQEASRKAEEAEPESPEKPGFPLLSKKEIPAKPPGEAMASMGEEQPPASSKGGGSLRITPIFKDESSGKSRESASESESQKRLARIQRIIEGLSDSGPGKPREPPEDGEGGMPSAQAAPDEGETEKIQVKKSRQGNGKAARQKGKAKQSKETPAGYGGGIAEMPLAKKDGKKGQPKKKAEPVPMMKKPVRAAKPLDGAKKKGPAKTTATPYEKPEAKKSVPPLAFARAAPCPKPGMEDGGEPEISPKGKPGVGGKPPISHGIGPSQAVEGGRKQEIDANEMPISKPLLQRGMPRREPMPPPSVAKISDGSQKKILPRIFPGGKLTPTVSPKTYVPPARREPLPKPSIDQGEQDGQKPSGEQPDAEAPIAEFPASIEARMDGREGKKEGPALPKPKSESSELYGKAKLPKEEDELSVPVPAQEEELPVPKPGEYGEAKDDLRRRLEDIEKLESAKKEAEEYLEQYAKQNILWLYELYKMGALPREEFLAKVKEKIGEDSGKGGGEPVAQNPALANLSQQIDKKYNK